MGLFKRLAGFLGLAKEEELQQHQNDGVVPPFGSASAHHLPRKGFSVPVQVPVERGPSTPLLLPCPAGDGGLQGLRWYMRRLKIDEDGDIADEFFVEVLPDTSSTSMEEHNSISLPRYEAMYNNTRPVVRNQVLLPNGKIQHQVEYQGRLEWL